MDGLDSPERIHELRRTIASKPVLRAFYLEAYRRFQAVLDRCPQGGLALELGSGGGFAKEVVPDLVTSDVIAYPGVDRIVDATAMPFEDRSLRAIFMLNVFHHVPNVEAFLAEARRCLAPGGRALIVDQYPGWPGKPILKHLHHEPFDDRRLEWGFPSSGPLSGANGALAWIVFVRDRARFCALFPELEILRVSRHSPLLYWLGGGLRPWSLVPGRATGLVLRVDRVLSAVSPHLASFMDVELVRRD